MAGLAAFVTGTTAALAVGLSSVASVIITLTPALGIGLVFLDSIVHLVAPRPVGLLLCLLGVAELLDGLLVLFAGLMGVPVLGLDRTVAGLAEGVPRAPDADRLVRVALQSVVDGATTPHGCFLTRYAR